MNDPFEFSLNPWYRPSDKAHYEEYKVYAGSLYKQELAETAITQMNFLLMNLGFLLENWAPEKSKKPDNFFVVFWQIQNMQQRALVCSLPSRTRASHSRSDNNLSCNNLINTGQKGKEMEEADIWAHGEMFFKYIKELWDLKQ